MSIVNAWISRDRALVAVDTKLTMHGAAIGDPEAPAEGSKLYTIVHLGAVIAHQGALGALAHVMHLIHVKPSQDFDALVDAMPAFVADAIQVLKSAGAPPELLVSQRFFLAGWSARKNQMVGVRFKAEETTIARTAFLDGDDWLSAWDDDIQGEAPLPDSVDAMKRIAIAQKVYAGTICPGENPVGGRLILAEVTRTATTVTDLGRFEDLAMSEVD